MKHFTVIFSPLALDDVEQIVGYYKQLRTGLGKHFAATAYAHCH